MLSQWRTTYQPGEWIVLAGPTSLVVIQPLAAEWASLLSDLWEEVLGSSSLPTLVDQLVAFGIADMPSFAAFFWTEDGMRSLVRGGVRVRDAATGETVAHGNGMQTWSEVGLGDLDRVVVEMPGTVAGQMELPLLVGAVYASSLTLDATSAVLLASPQGQSRDAVAPDSASSDGENGTAPEDHPDSKDDRDFEDYPDTEDYPAEHVKAMENADTELMPAPTVVEPEGGGPVGGVPAQGPPVVAKLVFSNGHELDLDETVRIGRAPTAEGAGDTARLVTVTSPNSDISRTHLQISPCDEDVVVTDLHSTNGTILLRPGRGMTRERLPSGESVSVPLGSLLDLGDGVSLLVEPPH